jgi:hypothetical protein
MSETCRKLKVLDNKLAITLKTATLRASRTKGDPLAPSSRSLPPMRLTLERNLRGARRSRPG